MFHAEILIVLRWVFVLANKEKVTLSNGLIFYTSLGRTIDQDDNQQVINALVFYYMRSRRLPALFADRIMQHFRHCRPHTHTGSSGFPQAVRF